MSYVNSTGALFCLVGLPSPGYSVISSSEGGAFSGSVGS